MVVDRELCRQEFVQCDVNPYKNFIYNGRFEVLDGHEHFQNGRLLFPTRPKPRNAVHHRSLFGPCVSNNGRILSNSNHNLNLALTRLTAVRDPTRPELEFIHTENQTLFCKKNVHIFKVIGARYARFFEMTSVRQAAMEHVGDPHCKRLLRLHAYQELIECGGEALRNWVLSVLYKLKTDEVSKPGKVGRMIGDLGVAASLLGFMLTKFLKKAQNAVPLEYEGGNIEFCASPKQAELRTHFEKLRSPPGRYHFVYFSDDSCYSVRDASGVVHTYNIDISKCDASHRPAIFQLLYHVVPRHLHKGVDELLDQCRRPIRLKSVEGGNLLVVLRALQITLYSGSTITTVINNLANMCLGIAFAQSKAVTAAEIVAAAHSVGYIVTVEECGQLEDIQFLKHSPCIDVEGNLQPVLNLGVLLRMSGTCKGDLPGRGDLVHRARVFQGSLLNGIYPHARFPIITGMKRAFPLLTSKKPIDHQLKYKVVSDEKDVFFRCTDEAVCKRYRLSAAQVTVMSLQLRSLDVGQHLSSPACSEILMRDYGLSC